VSTDFCATLREDSPRYQDWMQVFGTDTVYLKAPIPNWYDLPGRGATSCFDLDIASLTEEQKERMITFLANRFDVAEDVVRQDLDEIGCPIVTEDVALAIMNPLKWF
jgi:hypothetical protein